MATTNLELPGWRHLGYQLYADEHGNGDSILLIELRRSTLYAPATIIDALADLARTLMYPDMGIRPTDLSRTLRRAIRGMDSGLRHRLANKDEEVAARVAAEHPIHTRFQRERDVPYLGVTVAYMSASTYHSLIERQTPIFLGSPPTYPGEPLRPHRPIRQFDAMYECGPGWELVRPPTLLAENSCLDEGTGDLSDAQRMTSALIINDLGDLLAMPGSIRVLHDRGPTSKAILMLSRLDDLHALQTGGKL